MGSQNFEKSHLPLGGWGDRNFLVMNWGWVYLENEPLADQIQEPPSSGKGRLLPGMPVKMRNLENYYINFDML